MRVTETIKQDLSMSNIRKNAADIESISDRIASGKRVITPSDDPVNAIRGENQRTNLETNVSVKNNINVARHELNTIDFVLDEMQNILREAKVNMLEAANGHMTDESLMASASVADKQIRRLLDLSNTKMGKTFLFSGKKTFTEPVSVNRDEKKSETEYPGSIWKTNVHLSDQALKSRNEELGPGNLNLTYSNERGEERELRLFVSDPENNYENLLKELNRQIAEQFPSGEKGKPSDDSFRLQVGQDGAVYIESLGNAEIVDISSTLFKNSGMEFEKLSSTIRTEYSGREANAKSFYPALYGEELNGMVEKPLTVRIEEAGKLGDAKFVILNHEGEIISEPTELKEKNTIIDPNNSENQLSLNFVKTKGQTEFVEGVEFRFYPNNFAHYQGNSDYREVPLDGGRRVRVSVNAEDMFFKKDGESVNTFDILKGAHDAMLNADQDTVASFLDDIDIAMNQVLRARSRMGVSGIEVDAGESRVTYNDQVSTETLSDSIDQDIAEAATNLKKSQLKQEATYEVTSKLIQPGLIRFLQ